MEKDEIVAEVRAIREEHAARFGYDLNAIFRDLKEAEALSDRDVVSRPPKRLEPAEETNGPARG